MPTTTEWEAARRGCVDCCDRCLMLIDRMPSRAYVGAGQGPQPIGPHMRHIIDHFTAFLRGVATGRIEYDARERDERLERDLDAARSALEEIRQGLDSLCPEQTDRDLEIHQTPALETAPLPYASTGARELVFLSSHTIHHLALIACLCEQHDVELPESFGLAFSTTAHRQVAAG